MPNFLFIILVCLLVGAAPVRAAEKKAAASPEELSPGDRKVAAMMEVLELMDLADAMDMVKDINYLIEEDQNERQSD